VAEEEEEEEEEDTPHVDTWHNTRAWVDFFVGLHKRQILWYEGEKCDNKE